MKPLLVHSLLCLLSLRKLAAHRDEDAIMILGSSVSRYWSKPFMHYQHRCCNRTVYLNSVSGSDSKDALKRYTENPLDDRYITVGTCSSTEDALKRFMKDTTNASYIFVGLSPGNEGFKSYVPGMKKLVSAINKSGAIPIVGLSYPFDRYKSDQYEKLMQVNLYWQRQSVASVNFLGALDDGFGHWAKGFNKGDGRHPNKRGVREMHSAIVPSLFDAIKQGKLPLPHRGDPKQYLTVNSSEVREEPVTVRLGRDEAMHSFSYAISVRVDPEGGEGVVGSILGTRKQSPDACGFVLHLMKGKLGLNGQDSGIQIADGHWHDLVLAHYAANKSTNLYADGLLAMQVMNPCSTQWLYFNLASAAKKPGVSWAKGVESNVPALPLADYRDLAIWRSALHHHEVRVLAQERLVLQASLEVYAPLNPANLKENRAQSLTDVKVHAKHMIMSEASVDLKRRSDASDDFQSLADVTSPQVLTLMQIDKLSLELENLMQMLSDVA